MAGLNLIDRINRVRKWADHQIDLIYSYDNVDHRLILVCSLIDAFAQNDSNYQRTNNMKHFTEFLAKYAKEYNNVITEVCPITLFYNCFSDSNEELQLEKDRVFIAGDTKLLAEANRLINLLPQDQQSKKRERHTYGALIYAMRSKLVHEMNRINSPINFLEEDDLQLPSIVCELKKDNGKLIFKKWSLHIPPDFIFIIAKDAISGYLDHCESQGLDPFYNNNFERSCYYGWY